MTGRIAVMTTRWHDFERAEPELAGAVRARFGRYRHHVLATLKADGSPRLSGTEVEFRLDDLWLGSMTNARKALDLLRDPRCAVHANPGPGTDMDGGDVRIAGHARCVTDPATIAAFVDEVRPPEPFHLFRVELTEVVRTRVDEPAEDMIIQSWHPDGRGVRVLRRHGTDPTVREDQTSPAR
jgi:hypothetical protein